MRSFDRIQGMQASRSVVFDRELKAIRAGQCGCSRYFRRRYLHICKKIDREFSNYIY